MKPIEFVLCANLITAIVLLPIHVVAEEQEFDWEVLSYSHNKVDVQGEQITIDLWMDVYIDVPIESLTTRMVERVGQELCSSISGDCRAEFFKSRNVPVAQDLSTSYWGKLHKFQEERQSEQIATFASVWGLPFEVYIKCDLPGRVVISCVK